MVVNYDVQNQVATVTLNRPDSLNAMTTELMSGISQALERVSGDDDVRVVVLTGAGRGFCSGADLTAVASGANDSPATADTVGTAEQPAEDTFNSAMRALMDCPVPTIARVNGPAAGGGFGLALACDLTVAAESAFFVATFGPRLGIVPDMGATWNLPLRVGRARALGLTLLGDRVSAVQAQDWGLIWAAVPDESLDEEVARIAGALRRSSPDAAVRIRQTIDQAVRQDFSAQLDEEMRHQAILIPRNMTEGAAAFVEKREPVFSGERKRADST